MSRQFWHFATVALLGCLVLAALLEVLGTRIVERELVAQGSEQHQILARSLSGFLQPQLAAVLDIDPGLDRDSLRSRPAVNELRHLLRDRLENLDVVRLKIYVPGGTTVFSTDTEMIGDDQSANPGVRNARQGTPVSEIVRRDTLNPFEGNVEHGDLMHSYLPIGDADGAGNPVFEIYSDITPLLNRLEDARRRTKVGDFGLLGLFYIGLVGVYARADRSVQRERAEKQRYLQELERSRDSLEQQVTERTREIDDARRFLESVMDGVSDPVMVIDTDFRVTAMNRAARALSSPDQVPGEPLYCYRTSHHRDSPCEEDCTLEQVLLSGEAGRLIHTHYRPDGEPRRIEVSAAPLFDSRGAITGIVEVNHDITAMDRLNKQLRDAKEAAEQADAARSVFVATLSHEIRTPLNAVIGMTDLLAQTRLSDEQREYVQLIQSSGDMLLTVVDNVLDFSRPETAMPALEQRVFEPGRLLESVLQIMGYHASSRGLELTGQVTPPDQGRVSGDSDRLRQILVNLVSNAIRCTPRGRVQILIDRVSESAQEAVLRFEVRDSGIGIDATARERLFKPYPRSAEQADEYAGSGLGLMICKQLVDAMRGTIGLASEPGQGTTFWFEIPVGKVEEAAQPYPPLQPELAGRRVLVMATHPDLRAMLCHSLTSWDMVCEEALTADAAMQRLTQAAEGGEAFDYVIIDTARIDEGGIALAYRIREETATSGVALVLLSSVAQPLDVGIVKSLGGAARLHKPVLPRRLSRALLARVAQPEALAAPVAGPVSGAADSDRVRILVAEDNAISNRMLVDMLARLGFEADSTSDGPGVLDAVQRCAYDLILMDCQMPGLDGEEVTRRIRERGAQMDRQPVIVAVSADVTDRHQRECLQVGIDDFIGKPLRLEKLAQGLQRWLPASFRGAMAASQDDGAAALLAGMQKVLGATGDPDSVSRLLGLFLDDARARLQAMNTALEAAEFERLAREAHALKGGSLQLGITTVAELCDTLREAAGRGLAAPAAQGLDQVQLELERVAQAAGQVAQRLATGEHPV
jgi:PAS domain S-box-containing protein